MNTAYSPISKSAIRAIAFSLIVAAAMLHPVCAFSQSENSSSPASMKKLSIEELMKIVVVSVSKSPEKLTESASAIQVVEGDDIKRSTATRLPEALRLASNLQVAQTNSHDWAITARGFNGAPLSTNTLANKLLVMIDGRTVYSPLFGGVFWDVQNMLLEDVDRIEVVSGPGGTLWGANAVNGVINIMSKTAKQTQGIYASEAAGSHLQRQLGVRYGGNIDSVLYFRIYGQDYAQGETIMPDGSKARDRNNMTQGGFRIDYYPTTVDIVTIQGDIYKGKDGNPASTRINGQNMIAKWSHKLSENSNMTLQAYVDRTSRVLVPTGFSESLGTYDVDFQHRFNLGSSHTLLWGTGFRVMDDNVDNVPELSFIPPERTLQLFNVFVQDRVMLLPDKLDLTFGTKFLHNDYSGFEWQPSVRMGWRPDAEQTIWAAVSRAVRMPSRIDADVLTDAISTANRSFNSEKVIAYELGYRVRPFSSISISLATFYNRYNDLRSTNNNPSPPTRLLFANDLQASSYGIEFSGNAILYSWWRLRGGYTFMRKNFTRNSPLVAAGSEEIEAIDPNKQAIIQSVMDLPKNFQVDVTGRYVDALSSSVLQLSVPAYFACDIRLGWIYKRFSFSVAGQNLTQKSHKEFGLRTINRSIYQKITFRL